MATVVVASTIFSDTYDDGEDFVPGISVWVEHAFGQAGTHTEPTQGQIFPRGYE